MCRTIPLRRRDELLAIFVAAYDAGFKTALEGGTVNDCPGYSTRAEEAMWFEGFHLAQSLMADPDVQAG